MTTDDFRLADFRPRTSLRVPVHDVRRPKYPVVDAHNHLGSAFGGDWATRPPAELVATLDESGVETVVDLDGGYGDALSAEVDRWQSRYPDRVAVFAGLDYEGWTRDPEFGGTEAARLRDSAGRGARGLKVWKLLGLRARDPDGRLIAVDDPRLDPLWAVAAELDLPVVIHIADPIAFFEPLDPTNERWEELHAHPDWHFWPPMDAGDLNGPGFPRFDDLLAALGRLLGRHPGTTFVGAHVGCAAEDLGLVGRLLDANPNFNVDIAARLGELGRQPYSARQFFLRYADRILFGVDMAPDPEQYETHYRFLETFDESFDYGTDPVPGQGRWQIHGIGLPDDVLRKVYRDNARRVLRLGRR
ncbi:MAG TPA: amidohydrolase family protein [Candidatus Limnocylindrales bacterium]|jgi:predicted TIM-barrel fold metal-dependent hydrolase|nr:amidohydrolase family protein [Candidatus Limnocylindrales bacterium]